MPLKPVVFSDIDYTIVFDSELHPRTTELIQSIRERAHFILITARSRAECQPLPPIPNDGLVAENGAAVYLAHDAVPYLDPDWDALMALRQPALDAFREALISRGWRINHKLRAFSSGIQLSGKADAEVQWAVDNLPTGLQLQFSHNTAGDYLEVFPVEAGKDKAVLRVCEDLGVPVEATCGLGDNVNDLDMLRVVGLPLAPGNCHPQARELTLSRGGYVSPHARHEGAWDILQRALEQVTPW